MSEDFLLHWPYLDEVSLCFFQTIPRVHARYYRVKSSITTTTGVELLSTIEYRFQKYRLSLIF